MTRYAIRRAERHGLAAGEWFGVFVVFAVGLVVGTLALGDVDLAQAERMMCDTALRFGYKLQPRLQPTAAADEEVDGEIVFVDDAARHEQPKSAGPPPATEVTTGASGRKRTIVRIPPSPETIAGRATLDYWNHLNSIMDQESKLRVAPDEVTEANALSFVEVRARAAEFAAESLRKLDTQQVDAEVVALGQELAGWYDDGAKLSREAAYLLEEGTTEARQGARGETWKTGEQAHRQQCDELNRRGEQVRQQMATKYQLAFPPMK